MTDDQIGMDIVRAVQSGWPQLLSIGSLIAWAAVLNYRVKENSKRLDRHEARLSAFETTVQQQAVAVAEIREAVKGIKLTTDRIYSEVSELGRVQHHSARTVPPR